jgi:hypothetical protein
MLNDPVYNECATELARQAIDRCDGDIDTAIATMFQSVTGSTATASQASQLKSLYDDLSDPSPETFDPGALAIVANTILNLDQALTK